MTSATRWPDEAIADARRPTTLFRLSTDTRAPVERLGYTAVALLTLSPVVAHMSWRLVATALRTDGDAVRITGSALLVGGIVWAVRALWSGAGGRWIPGVVCGLAALVIAAVVGAGDSASTAAAAASLLGVAAFSGLLAPWMVQRLPRELDGLARRHRLLTGLFVIASAAAVVQTARVGSFMGDASRRELSLVPSVPFLVRHSCLTAYVEGARLASEGDPNVYDADHWPDLGKSESARVREQRYAPFQLDAFAYPPPFLLLPRALLLPIGDYASQRALWFGVNALISAAGLWLLAAWVGGRARLMALLLAPAVWVSLPSMAILQIGNVHASVLIVALLAMVAFGAKRPVLGGALLAFAILSKISPGLLVLLLLVQRRFREALWTGAFCVGFALLGAAVFGVAPYHAFVSYQLPRLGSGAALSFMTGEESLPMNMSPFGVPFKLASLGVAIADEWAVARSVNRIFTVVSLALTVIAARKATSPRIAAMLWIAVLTLGTLRSPFAPAYVTVPVLWLFSLWASEVRRAPGAVVLALSWAVLSVTPPLPTHQLVVLTLVQQCLLFGVLAYVVLRGTPRGEAPRPVTVDSLVDAGT